MKKCISVFLTALFVMSALILPANAQKKIEKLSVSFSNDIAGLTYDDYDKFNVTTSDNITFDEDPIFVASYSGDVYLDEIKPGRTYYIYYSFVAKDGYKLPDELNEENVEVNCGNGCELIWYGKTIAPDLKGNIVSETALFYVKVKTSGNFFQRFFGRIADIVLKIKAWSLY